MAFDRALSGQVPSILGVAARTVGAAWLREKPSRLRGFASSRDIRPTRNREGREGEAAMSVAHPFLGFPNTSTPSTVISTFGVSPDGTSRIVKTYVPIWSGSVGPVIRPLLLSCALTTEA